MSTTSSSSPSSQSIPPLNIKHKQPEPVSPLSYPELHPLLPYAHEQEQSTTPSVSDDSISTKTSHSITSISREIIHNLSSTLQSQQCQTLIEDILQDCRTFDSLRTQVEQSQQKIKEQTTAIMDNSAEISNMLYSHTTSSKQHSHSDPNTWKQAHTQTPKPQNP